MVANFRDNQQSWSMRTVLGAAWCRAEEERSTRMSIS